MEKVKAFWKKYLFLPAQVVGLATSYLVLECWISEFHIFQRPLSNFYDPHLRLFRFYFYSMFFFLPIIAIIQLKSISHLNRLLGFIYLICFLIALYLLSNALV
jgi:hypothetical protein